MGGGGGGGRGGVLGSGRGERCFFWHPWLPLSDTLAKAPKCSLSSSFRLFFCPHLAKTCGDEPLPFCGTVGRHAHKVGGKGGGGGRGRGKGGGGG